MHLSRFAKVDLCHQPTPLEPMPALSKTLGGPSLFIKRDDCTGLATGGNKTRKLEFLMAEALVQEADTVLTEGAVQSNHARHNPRRRPAGGRVASVGAERGRLAQAREIRQTGRHGAGRGHSGVSRRTAIPARGVNLEKLLERLAAGSLHNVSFADLCRLADALGFRLDRVRGRHHIYVHREIPVRLNLQDRRG